MNETSLYLIIVTDVRRHVPQVIKAVPVHTDKLWNTNELYVKNKSDRFNSQIQTEMKSHKMCSRLAEFLSYVWLILFNCTIF